MVLTLRGGHLATSRRVKPAHPSRRALSRAPRDEASQVHHHVVAFHRDRDGLRDVRPLHHARAGLDIDWIGFRPEPLRIAIGLTGADIEFPAVPGAADDLA